MAGRVISGEYEGRDISIFAGTIILMTGLMKSIEINKNTVDSYEVIDQTSRKKVTSAVGRAAVGSFLLGPVGLVAGVSAKNKGTYLIALQFKDGKRSLIEVDDKIYKAIARTLF